MERELEADHEFIVNRALKNGNIHACDAFTNCGGVDTVNAPHPHSYNQQQARRYSMDWAMSGLINNVQHSRSTSFSSTASNKRTSIATLSESGSSDRYGISPFIPSSCRVNNSLLDSLYEQLAIMHAKHSQREHQCKHKVPLLSISPSLVQKQIDELRHENDILHDELLKARLLSSSSCNILSFTGSNKKNHHFHHFNNSPYLSKSAPNSPEQSRSTRRPSELSVESITSDGISNGIQLRFDGATDNNSTTSSTSHGKGRGRSGRREKSFEGYC